MKIGIKLHIDLEKQNGQEAKRLVTHFIEQINQNRINPDEYTWEKLEHDCKSFNDGSIDINQFQSRIIKSFEQLSGTVAA